MKGIPYKRILVIEKDPVLAETVCECLAEDSNFKMRKASESVHGLNLGLTWKPEVIVLDLALACFKDQSLLKRFHAECPRTKICAISSDGSLAAKLEAFAQGADDFLAKPFACTELSARVAALCRRDAIVAEPDLMGGAFVLDASGLAVSSRGKVQFTPKEADLLRYLGRRTGRPISRDELLDTVWEGKDRFQNVVDATVDKIRKKLVSIGCGGCLHTAYGCGYYFEPQKKIKN